MPSIAGGKSTSGWLDRLRSSRGIPTGTDVDLDHFITHNVQNDAVSAPAPAPAPPQPTAASRSNRRLAEIPAGENTMFNLMSNVLAELFVMGGGDFPNSKCSRKQRNPSFCGGPVISPAEGSVKLVENVSNEEDQRGGEKNWHNLSGFSRTEVTVIDTSFANWKFEKMLFRKKNLWRVRDKRTKGGHFAKKKKTNLKPRPRDEAMAADNDDAASKEEYRESDKLQATSTSASANSSKAVKKRRVALNPEKGSSSVVLVKNVPADKKGIPRSWSEKTNHKQQS